MREDDFNLIREPWIRVREQNGTVKEVSLLELFRDAHTFQALAGELPTQNAAVLRVLLAVLHTVFSRVDAEGAEIPLEELSNAQILARWGSIWHMGKFPVKPIETYLNSVMERFWLFDPVHPFFQCPAAKKLAGPDEKGILKCKAEKLNSAIDQSNNKARIFLGCSGEKMERLSYAEAARWLIHLVECGDAGLKESSQSKKNTRNIEKGSPGVGWLAKLGIVYAEGDNLFETMMLNFVLWPNGEGPDLEEETPLWELEQMPGEERQKLPWPDNMAALLTYPCRFVMLERKDGYVIGCDPLFGVFFDENEDAANLEQMTRRNGKKNENDSQYRPIAHEQGTFLWQEFNSLLSEGTEGSDQRPGVVRWIGSIQGRKQGLTRDKRIRFHSVSISHKNGSSIEQVEEDRLDLHANLISELGRDWRKVICQEVEFTQKVSWQLGYLAEGLWIAASGNKAPEGKAKDNAEKQVRRAKDAAVASFYQTMDLAFRSWVCGISAEDPNMEDKRREWRDFVRYRARAMGEDMALQAGPSAYAGHSVANKNKEPRFYSTAAVYGNFLRNINNIH